jgi:hypothetical protein
MMCVSAFHLWKGVAAMATVISYGGGIQSTALVVLAMLKKWDIDEIVHVDLLSAESPSTREYVVYFASWLQENHQRNITILTRDLYGDMLKHPQFTPVPWRGRDESFILRRQCTRQYKVEPVRSYLKGRYPDPIRLMLGISVDEWHRMRMSGDKGIEHVYPLVDERLTRSACRSIIERAGLVLPGKSSCWFCPYRSARSQRDLIRKYPWLIEMASALEDRINEERHRQGKDDIAVLRVRDEGHEQSDFCDEGFCDS